MNADVLTTRVADGIAVITLGSARRIYFDEEMGDALTAALDGFAGDARVRGGVVTGGAPGYFIRHYSIAALIRLAESLRASGREWPENATYNGGFLDKAIALCESMPKPVIAAISGTALAGGFEFALSCDLRVAEEDRKSTRLNSSHLGISYAVFCLKKKKKHIKNYHSHVSYTVFLFEKSIGCYEDTNVLDILMSIMYDIVATSYRLICYVHINVIVL